MNLQTSLGAQDLQIKTTMPSILTARSLDEKQTEILVDWQDAHDQQLRLELEWRVPLLDIQYEWYPTCGRDRRLRIDWEAPIQTESMYSAPVFCFYNQQGVNRFTVALSDVCTRIQSSLGVHEEDGTLLCRIIIPLPQNANCYQVILYRNQEPVSFSKALQRVATWWENECGIIPMEAPHEVKLPVYSTWYGFHQATYASDLEAEAQRAAQLGMKVMIVDDGWQTSDMNRGYRYCGDWLPATDKIPDMRTHVQAVHDAGMKYMLWFGVPRIGIYSKAWSQFSHMFLHTEDDGSVGFLDPRYPQVRQHLINTYVRALNDWNLDGFKLDFIDNFSIPTKDIPAPAPEMDIPRVEDAVARLFTDVMATLRSIKPDILIEFRQCYMGPKMRTYGNMFRVTDCPADLLTNRVGIADLRQLFGKTPVHSDMLMWHKQDKVELAARQILNVIFGVPQLSMRLDQLAPDHLEMLSFWIKFITEHQQLLASPLKAESPQSLYPVLRTILHEEEAIGVYQENYVVTLSDAETAFLFNATSETDILVKTTLPCTLTATVFDCMGHPHADIVTPCTSLHLLNIPISGYAVIHHVPKATT